MEKKASLSFGESEDAVGEYISGIGHFGSLSSILLLCCNARNGTDGKQSGDATSPLVVVVVDAFYQDHTVLAVGHTMLPLMAVGLVKALCG